MASFYSNNHDGRQLRLDVTQDGGYANWKLTSSGGISKYYTIYNLEIIINGTTVYNPGYVGWSTEKFPAATGSISGEVWIGNGASDKTIYVSFKGSVYSNLSTQNGGNFTMKAYIFKPSLGPITLSKIADTYVTAAFSVTNNNGQAPNSPNIQISLTNFGSAIKTINARSGTFDGLDANRTYYIRGSDANDAGRTYTNTWEFTTIFNNPSAPGRPILSYDQSEPIPSANLKATWTSATAGSTAIAGYRLILYKNNVQVHSVDTDTSAIAYTFGTFEDLGFQPGDVAKIGIYAYCLDWNGVKHFNGNGNAGSEVYSSNTITMVSDKYIYASINGGSFNKHKMYVSVNGGDFFELKKEDFKVIQ